MRLLDIDQRIDLVNINLEFSRREKVEKVARVKFELLASSDVSV